MNNIPGIIDKHYILLVDSQYRECCRRALVLTGWQLGGQEKVLGRYVIHQETLGL